MKKHKPNIKTKDQIEGIKKSCKLAAKSLKYIEPFVKPGVSTGYLNDKLDEFIRDNSATPACLNYKGYPKSTCISLNEIICHGIPGEEEIKDGDILNIDVTTILDGYYGDTSKMYTVGEISPAAKNLIRVTKECLKKGIQQVKDGNYIRNIGMAIYMHAIKFGYTVVEEFCGHGTGIEFHEPPMIPHVPIRSDEKMYEGMVFTIEPMINLGKGGVIIDEQDKWTARTVDGKLSAQFEHTVLVTKKGYEILT